ncbi:RICIN domain-containing protein [Streptosporangium sp. NBC_01469]|nr:RICIN domain-containing protein [Streptosporangium sp. NBC_01469]
MPVSAASAAPVDPPTGAVWLTTQVTLLSDPNKRCMLGKGKTVMGPVTQYPCMKYDDQLWVFNKRGTEPVSGEDYYWISNVNSGMCVVVQGGANNAPAKHTRCANYADQHWYVDYTNGWDGMKFRNRNSNKCLVARGTTPGTQLVQSACADYNDQDWNGFIWP